MRKFSVLVAAAVSAVAVPGVAMAQLTAAQLEPIGDAITGSVAVLMPWAIGLAAVVVGGLIALGLLKKFARKAGG